LAQAKSVFSLSRDERLLLAYQIDLVRHFCNPKYSAGQNQMSSLIDKEFDTQSELLGSTSPAGSVLTISSVRLSGGGLWPMVIVENRDG